MDILYDYQQAVIPDLLRNLRPDNPTLLVAPTGAGKTVIAAEIALHFRSVLWVAHRIELIDQAKAENGLNVQVMSVLSALRHGPPKVDLLIIDEAHRGMAKSYQNLMRKYRGCSVLGMTATPLRTDGQGLIDVFDEIVQCSNVKELVASGHLVPFVAYEAPDEALQRLKDIKKERGDFAQSQASELMCKPRLIGNVVREYVKRGERRKAIVFAVSVKHSIALTDAFLSAGVRAAHLDGKASPKMRAERLADLSDGRIDVLCNVNLFTEGWDCPAVSCVIMARPTLSLSLYLQSVGRGMRASEGKENLLILDHAGNMARHGYPDEDRKWSLESEAQREKRDGEVKELERIYSLGFVSLEEYELEQRKILEDTYEFGEVCAVLSCDKHGLKSLKRRHKILPVPGRNRYLKSDIHRIVEHEINIYSLAEALAILSCNIHRFRVLRRRYGFSAVSGGSRSLRYAKTDIDRVLESETGISSSAYPAAEARAVLRCSVSKFQKLMRRYGIKPAHLGVQKKLSFNCGREIYYLKSDIDRLVDLATVDAIVESPRKEQDAKNS